MRTLALIAGEASGDQLGGWLMEALRRREPAIRFIGIGGPMMQAQGLTSLFPMQEISLMGFAEILPHVFRLKRRIRETVAFIEREKPEILVTIDSPGFVVRVVKELRARAITRPQFIHYVAPTVWAYKPERAAKMAANFDHLLCLLPFEPPYFEAENLATTFIGHEVAWWWRERGDGAAFRKTHSIAPDAPVLAVFPGSRSGEIKRMWPVFRAAIAQLRVTLPTLRIVIQVPTSLVEPMQALSTDALVLANTEDKKNVFAAATAALAKSGTISLECALAGLPSITVYRAHPLTVFLIRRMAKIPYANLANILAKRMIIPELIQEDCTPEKLVEAVLPLLTDAQARATQLSALRDVAQQLGASDTLSPSDKAAAIILK